MLLDVFRPSTEGLRELNIYETKDCEIKVCELDLEKCKNCGKIANERICIAFIYGLYLTLE